MLFIPINQLYPFYENLCTLCILSTLHLSPFFESFAAIADKLFADWVHGLRYVSVDVAHLLTLQVKTIHFCYVNREVMQFVYNGIEIMRRTDSF